jgi:hypothetical protein
MAKLFSLLYDGEAFMAHMAKVTKDLMVGGTAMNGQEATLDSLVQFLLTRLCYRAFFSTVGDIVDLRRKWFCLEMILFGSAAFRLRLS